MKKRVLNYLEKHYRNRHFTEEEIEIAFRNDLTRGQGQYNYCPHCGAEMRKTNE